MGGGEVPIWESVQKCQNYRFFDIFWDILDKRNSNLGQECAKTGKIEIIAPDFPGKITVLFPVLTLLPKIWRSHPHKIYIF